MNEAILFMAVEKFGFIYRLRIDAPTSKAVDYINRVENNA